MNDASGKHNADFAHICTEKYVKRADSVWINIFQRLLKSAGQSVGHCPSDY